MLPPLTYRPRPLDLSGFTFARDQERAQTKALHDGVTTLCKKMLESDDFSTEVIQRLARRECYPLAASALLEASGCTPALLDALIIPPVPAIAPYRFARLFHAIPDYEEERPLTILQLELLKIESADCALAALGIIDWKIATTRTRAVFALRALIAGMRS